MITSQTKVSVDTSKEVQNDTTLKTKVCVKNNEVDSNIFYCQRYSFFNLKETEKEFSIFFSQYQK
jgi:hypothetical protein